MDTPKRRYLSGKLLIATALIGTWACQPIAFSDQSEKAAVSAEECTTHRDQSPVPETANRSVMNEGVDLDYQLRDIAFGFISKTWNVSYNEKAISLDGCFRVSGKDETEEDEFRACP